MKGLVRDVLRELERLGHDEVLEPQKSDGMTERVLCFEAGLGARKLACFAALHREALEACLSRLARVPLDAEALAVGGRALRLLGKTALARARLRRSLRVAETSRAHAWLGEIYLREDPAKAHACLSASIRLDPAWAWPHLCRAVLCLAQRRPAECLRSLEDYRRRARAPRPMLYDLLSSEAFLQLRDFARALKRARAAIRRDRSCPAGHLMAAYVCAASRDARAALGYSDAAHNLDEALEGTFVLHACFGVAAHRHQPREYLEALKDAIARHPATALLYAVRAELERSPLLCLYDEALRDCRKSCALSPGSAWLWANLGRAQNFAAGGRAGIESLSRALRLSPRSGWMRAWRGAIYARLGERERALVDLNGCISRMPWYAQAYSWRGALLNSMGRPAQARGDLDRAILLMPGHAFSLHERFKAHAALKDFKRAVSDLNGAFRQDPKYSWLGGRSADPATLGRELAVLDEAVAAHPRLTWLRAWRGNVLLQSGDAARALPDLEHAARRLARSGLIRAWFGQALRALGRLDHAEAELQAAARLDSGLWISFQGLAEIQVARGEYSRALESISRVTQLAPTTAPPLVLKAELEQRLGMTEQALCDLEKALRLHSSYREAHVLKARILLDAGRAELASSAAQKAIDLPEPPAMAYIVRGMARRALGDLEGQLADFRMAVALAPELFSAPRRGG